MPTDLSSSPTIQQNSVSVDASDATLGNISVSNWNLPYPTYGSYPPAATSQYLSTSSVPPPYNWAATPSLFSSSVDRPYVVRLLNNIIKKCSGCEEKFAMKLDGSSPDPTNDLIIGHEERRPFSDAQNVTRLSRLQNVYYHANIHCIRRYN